MALTIPAPIQWLSSVMRGATCRMDMTRHEEVSRNGASQLWTAEIARPTWTAHLTLAARHVAQAREIDAKMRALGSNRALLFADPAYQGPGLGEVWRLAGSPVTVSQISGTRRAIRLTGLPSGFRISVGDRFSMTFAGRHYLGEFAEPITAPTSGQSALVDINPPLPASITTGAPVELVQPVCQMIVPPDGYTAFDAQPGFITGATSLRLEQKV